MAAAVLAGAGCGPAGGGLRLHPASAMVRIGGPGGIATPPARGSYTLTLAGNESEAMQVRVTSAADPRPLAVGVTVETLPPPAGAGETPSAYQPTVTAYQVLAVHHPGPAEHASFQVPKRNVGWIPDVCLPATTAVAQPHEPEAVTFLFDVHASPIDPSGGPVTRTVRLSFRRQGAPAEAAAQLHLTVAVHPYNLPRRLPFKTAVTWNWNIDKYLGRSLTEAERAAYLGFFGRHRFTPASFWSIGPDMSEDEVRRVRDAGGNVFQLFGRGGRRALTDQQKQDLAPKLAGWREMMKRAGALDDCYALVADEPAEEYIPNIRDTAAWLKGVFPEVHIWVATAPRKDLLDVVDCWDVVTAASTELYAAHCHSPAGLAMARAAPGKPEYWWFYSVEPYAPHANARLDDALVDSRAIGWMSYAAGVDGFEYFWATDWAANADLRDVPWPAKAARWKTGLSGAGQLCYPDDAGLPIPSLRLINLRDAMEDWAAFTQAGPAFRQKAPPEVRDPRRLAQLRHAADLAVGR